MAKLFELRDYTDDRIKNKKKVIRKHDKSISVNLWSLFFMIQ